jgi:hypothetical protein
MPSYCIRRFGLTPGVVGTALSLLVGAVGGASQLLAGAGVRALVQWTGGDLRWNVLLPAMCCVVAVPSGLLCYQMETFGLCLAAFVLPTVASNCFAGPADAMIYSMTKPVRRRLRPRMHPQPIHYAGRAAFPSLSSAVRGGC